MQDINTLIALLFCFSFKKMDKIFAFAMIYYCMYSLVLQK